MHAAEKSSITTSALLQGPVQVSLPAFKVQVQVPVPPSVPTRTRLLFVE